MSKQSARVQMHFAHANGFPSGSYRAVFDALDNQIKVLSKPHFASEQTFKHDRNWHTLVNELIHYCEQFKHADIPLWAVGHSMGAIVSFKACCERPDLFDGLIMFDPPLVTGPFAPLLRAAKKTAAIDKITPASLSAVRRSYWHKSEDPVAYFKSKALFKNMDDKCIADYVDSGLVSKGEGRELVIKAATEAQLFRHVPDDLNRLNGMLQCPGVLVTGRASDVCRPIMYRRFVKRHNMRHTVAEGGHMFPLEHPKATATLLNQLLLE
ncbi:alpha/beta hydrolase [Alteromonas sediminis]|uniref:Alpha/beta hydrolase n=1 Tax=Alteromonas sediminis TaxID=2259342 RepID=A0A3N5Y3B6_9ALTE|nr:alpha/beta hydrolase [Alteromonas sediminis]RPJ67266.1 alpha/beta hydrolase [Alteromonas sediminis]